MRMWYLDELESKLLFWLVELDAAKLMGRDSASQLDAERSRLALLVEQKADIVKRVGFVMGAIEEGATGMVKRLQELEESRTKIEKQLEAQERKVAVESAKQGSGGTRLEALTHLFKALHHTKDEVELRALREQLSAAVAGLVEMIGLYPRGPSSDSEKEDRFLKVLLKNGQSFEVEAPGLNA